LSRPSIVMFVFNGLEFDGRVQRAASALAPIADVHVLGLCGEGEVWRPPDGAYSTEGVPGPMLGLKAQRSFRRRMRTVVGQRRPQLVYGHDYYTAWSAREEALRVGAKFVYDAHELLKPSPGQKRSLRERLFALLERMGASDADLVICANEPRARLFHEYHGLTTVPLVIRNIPDESQEPPLSEVKRDPLRILYQGDLSAGRRLELLIQALPYLDANSSLVLAGGGPALDKLRSMASAAGLDHRITFLGRVPRSDLPRLMAESGVGVLSYPASDLNNVYCAPNKVYEYARAGLPMVAIGSEHLRELVEGPGLGLALDAPSDPAQLAGALRAVVAERLRHAGACRAFARGNTWAREAERLREAVGRLLGASGSSGAAVPGRGSHEH